MQTKKAAPATIDEYIAAFPPPVQKILTKIRKVVRSAAPEASEVISYGMPALKGRGVLVYFAAFKAHVGLYPPIHGDAALAKEASRYANEKGNLRFPLAEPIPYDLIERITQLRVRQDRAKARAKRR